MGGTAGHAKHFFFITWPKTKWGQKAFQDSDGDWTSQYSDWKDSQAEKHGGILTRLIQHPKQTNSEDLKIFAYPEGFFTKIFQPKRCLKYWKIISREVTRTTYRKAFKQ